jgi:hypothetical protein
VRKDLDAGEALMAQWLTDRGYTYEFEPEDWGVNTCPDFRVDVSGHIVAIEVESIEGWGGFANTPVGQGFTRGMDRALRPLRAKIKEGARQLKPLAGTGMPLLVAVANPFRRPVPFSADMMISAMYGDPSYRFSTDRPGGQMLLDRNGKLTNDHSYVSAVMTIRTAPGVREAAGHWFDENRTRFASAQAMMVEARRLESEGFFGNANVVAVDLIETVATGSARLPAGFASGPNDTHWGPLPDGSGIMRLS